LIQKRKEAEPSDSGKKSRSGSYSAANTYIDKVRYGEANRDDSDVEDEALQGELADKTPKTQRRMINEDNVE